MSKRFQAVGIALMVLFAAGSTPAAQTIDLSGGNAEQIWHGSAQNTFAGSWMDQGGVSRGDSRRDLIIGAPGTATTTGKVFVIFGGPRRAGEFSLNNADAIITSLTTGDQFGFATAAGNILNVENTIPRNLIVGAPAAGGGRGRVYIFGGGFTEATSISTADAVYEIVGQPGDRLGTALATADLNNDGYREVIIGAGGRDLIYIINGGPSLTGVRDLASNPADLVIGGVGLGDVLAAGDVTGDNISDLLVGSGDLNVVYLYRGKASGGLPTVPDAGFPGAKAGDRAGSTVRLGDLDGDNLNDVIIGAPGSDGPEDGRPEAGAVYVLFGSPGLASRNLALADVTFHGVQAGHQLGASVTSGDINRDIPNDLVMLAPGNTGGPGQWEIYYGRSRSRIGVALPDGRRIVDLATPENVDRRILGDGAVGPMKTAQVFEVTGEGARDVIVSVPSAAGNTGAVYFTLSPRLQLSARSMNVILNEGNNVAANGFTIVNPSNVPITWAVSENQSWVTVSPGAGNASAGANGPFNVFVSTANLPPGVHTGTVSVTSTSKHLTMTLPVTVTLRVTATRVAIDAPATATTVVQPFVLSGWALERTALADTGIDAVHVYAYPNPGSGRPPVFIGAAQYGNPRGDVAAAYGPQFQNPGYSISVKGLAPGPYRFVVYARNKELSRFTHYSTIDVTVRNNPAIGIYTPQTNTTVTSAFEVSGWAIDRAAATGAGVDAIHVYVYPNPGSGQAPVFIGAASYGWSTPDVATVFGSQQFSRAGFHFTITGLGPGVFDLAVFARSTVSGQFDHVLMHRITVNANALMAIDRPAAEGTSSRPFTVRGWAIDRAAASGTGVDTLHIYAYPDPGSGRAPIFLGVATYGTSRPDVAALYGTRYTNSGYTLNVSSLTPGVYDVVVFARSTATGTFNNHALVRTTVQ